MKHCASVVLIALALLGANGLASEARLAWDPSTTAGVTNYVLYAHTNVLTSTNLASAAVRLNVGTNLTARVEALVPGLWRFAATAFKDGLESGLSNILLVEVPGAPQNMRTVVVQFGGTLTNFYDVGFFRLRLP